MYQQSIGADSAEKFWDEAAREHLQWSKPFSRAFSNGRRFEGDVNSEWFADGTLNASVNCLDRHLEHNSEKVAFHWEPDMPSDPSKSVTYGQLHADVCRFANALRDLGVGRGDTVTICMPMVPESVVSVLACARIGAIHSVIFGGFSAAAIAGRIEDCQSKVVITADEGKRNGKAVPLKKTLDEALELSDFKTQCVDNVVVLRHSANESVGFRAGRDVWWHDAMAGMSETCLPEEMSAEDPLFILYTSGSTGTPKGVQHSTGGYMLQAAMTHKHIFDYRPDDVYWCTADIGWITGHTYIVYGPLANGATSVMYEGVPNAPTPSRIWEICDKFKVTQCYTSPTAIRALMADGDDYATRTSRKSLRLLGTVGEPINPAAWQWFDEVVGDSRCPIVDTWWQTETGGVMMTPLPGATVTKPGSCCQPYFGIEPVIVDGDGKEMAGEAEGNLCIKNSWPGQLRTLYKNHERFLDTYFSTFKGMYFTGDRARRDEDGFYWITGRADDVLNVSGHRLGTAEIESALVSHPTVAEAAVVGYPHEIKGMGIYAFVSLMAGEQWDDSMKKDLVKQVRTVIGPIASPDIIQHAPGLPKTRSGKIMRRILRKVAENDTGSLGDTSTLQDPSVVEELVENRQNK